MVLRPPAGSINAQMVPAYRLRGKSAGQICAIWAAHRPPLLTPAATAPHLIADFEPPRDEEDPNATANYRRKRNVPRRCATDRERHAARAQPRSPLVAVGY